MNLLIAFVLAFSALAGEDYRTAPPPERIRDGLKGAVRQVAEESGRYRRTRSYDAAGQLTSEWIFDGAWTIGRKYEVGSGGPHAVCYQTNSMIGSSPPSLAARPVYRPNCGEFYELRYDYRREHTSLPGGRAVVTPNSGAVVVERALAGRELAWRTVWVYDARWRLTEAVEVSALDLKVRRNLYAYEGDSHAPATHERQADGKTLVKVWYEYVYDERGNWVSRKTLKQEAAAGYGVESGELKRTITYY